MVAVPWFAPHWKYVCSPFRNQNHLSKTMCDAFEQTISIAGSHLGKHMMRRTPYASHGAWLQCPSFSPLSLSNTNTKTNTKNLKNNTGFPGPKMRTATNVSLSANHSAKSGMFCSSLFLLSRSTSRFPSPVGSSSSTTLTPHSNSREPRAKHCKRRE